ncbi:hypothetical protein H257_01903 [Aphanomyces astaci]|uniref:Uncharacterized protein n=1 Tax=Aphanomyces astaci TaxID=112090 RepID=W4H4M2_APHAT|nr:hypothetical protein H257_01903 [Aphanomyces astaci]ETV86852.1 hypothetical protein H257_01903 [Aphanomyces astaci]|eukprot:XP_009823651.1 hypothetical protein H257_01903 [Aphanomyces astaci]
MRIALSTKPTHRPRTVGAFEVLTSLDLMLLILDFQGGVYNSHHPLRRLGYYTLATPPLSTDHMQAVDALLSPWLAIFTPSRMLTFLRSTDKYRHSILAAYAAYVGHLPAVRLLIENTTHKCSEASVIDWAAYGGHLHVIQFVHKVSSETARCTTWAMDIAATHNHTHVLEWLHLHRAEGCTVEAVHGATRHGHLEALQWLAVGNRARTFWFENAIVIAASMGHLDTLKWLHAQLVGQGRNYSRNNPLHEALATATSNGHADIVQWMRRRVLPTSEIDVNKDVAALEEVEYVASLGARLKALSLN